MERLFRGAMIPGEPSVDRDRKGLAVMQYLWVGVFCGVWFAATFATTFTAEGSRELTGHILNKVGLLVISASLLPVALYVRWTRKISRRLCEYPAIACSVAAVVLDGSFLMYERPSCVSVNVIVLDTLLLTHCSDFSARFVIGLSVVWISFRSVLELELSTCDSTPARSELGYYTTAIGQFSFHAIVLLVDFHYTRGFARSMNSQKKMVEASVQFCEVAAVMLSRYETDGTKELLEGPDGEGLPEGLRAALLQLVSNLADYRPYLPQSCLPDGDTDSISSRASGSSDYPECRDIYLPPVGARSVHSSLCSNDSASNSKMFRVRASPASNVKLRRLSLLSVNAVSFTRYLGQSPQTAVSALLCSEVDLFTGSVAAEHGVVDVVSGDHFFANFNAARTCPSHRVCAARVSWKMWNTDIAAESQLDGATVALKHTAAVCGGAAVSGDFGNKDVRRFMVLGPLFNSMCGLERVAARLGSVLLNNNIATDADVGVEFFCALAERVQHTKWEQDPRPFLVWQLAGRSRGVDTAEWMYQLEQQRGTNPHTEWNQLLHDWLHFGEPPDKDAVQSRCPPFPAAVDALSRRREQSTLVEATVAGNTVALALDRAPKEFEL